MQYLKANILFSDGKSFCPYISNHQCTIYNNRPSICRVYPLSPNLDNKIYIDDTCPAINTEFGTKIVENGTVTKQFAYKTLVDYQNKFLDTHIYLEKFNDINDFEEVITIKNMSFFKYIKQSDDKYMSLHLNSLQNMEKI